MTNLTGKTIKGYEIQTLIGEGGFGAVYRAYQTLVKREVAVKVILPEYASEPEFIRRFEAEAQLVARLEHLNIVPLFDYWRDPDGAFLVMRWLRGGSLREWLKGGPLSLEQAARVLDQIAAALAVAHRSGVIHRDLKPDNILLDEERNAYLADFGIAKDLLQPALQELPDDEAADTITGSPSYMSPEQIMGIPLTAASDIYSLGVVLYEILIGRPPFEAPAPSMLILKHLNEFPPFVHDLRQELPTTVSDVIHTAMAKKPEERYATTLAMAQDFRRAIGGLVGEAGAFMGAAGGVPLGPTERLAGLDEVTPLNPYKGLRAFQEADEDDFYGRDSLIQRLLDRFSSARFMAVVGPSGSGKSSAVRAGLLPTLRRGRLPGSDAWFVVDMTPGAHVYDELAAALLKVAVRPPHDLAGALRADGLDATLRRVLPPDEELLLFIDQFEEVFTQTTSEADRTSFLNALLAATTAENSRLRCILTLRADFYDRPLLYPEFGELLRGSTEVVLPMNSAELERAIVFPAENAGLGLEMGLVTAIVADVAEQAGALPLLQFALTELFERRDGRWLTLQAYRDIGGVSGALAKRADALYAELAGEAGADTTTAFDKTPNLRMIPGAVVPTTQPSAVVRRTTGLQEAARQLFLRLVTLGEGTEDTRRRVQQSELLSLQNADQVQAVIDLFARYRLLTLDRDPTTRAPTVEVAHEALIRRWGLLRDWLNDSRESLLLNRKLTAAAAEWLAASKDRSYLAAGTRLEQFAGLAQEGQVAITDQESAYVRASLAERDRQNAEEAARQQEKERAQRRSRNQLRALVAVFFSAAVSAVGLSLFAFDQTRIAGENAATATNAQGEALLQADNAATAAAQANSQALASGAQLALARHDTDQAIVLALAANRPVNPPAGTLRTLAQSVYAPGTRRVLTGHEDWVRGVAYAPDGLTAVSASSDRTLIVWDVQTGEIVRRFGGDGSGHTDWVWSAAYSPDGAYVLSGSSDRTLILWDVATGAVVRRFGTAFNAAGEGHQDVVSAVAFSPDGARVLSGSWDTTLILWDVATGEAIQRFGAVGGVSGGHTANVNTVAFGPGGLVAFSGSDDNTAIFWNTANGQPLLRFGGIDGDGERIGHTGAVLDVLPLPDGAGLLTASADQSLLLWSLETGEPVRRYTGHTARVYAAALSPDGFQMATVSEDRSAILWDVSTATVLQRYTGHAGQVLDIAFDPNGAHFLTAASDATLRLWDVTDGAQIARFDAHDQTVYALRLSPDGRLVASGALDNTLYLWERETGEIVHTLEGHEDALSAVSFSADGAALLSSSIDGTIIVWDTAIGSEIRRLNTDGNGHEGRVWTAALSPDGNWALSGGGDGDVILWDVETGDLLHRFEQHTAQVQSLVFSVDGQRAASGSQDTSVILWDLAGRGALRTFSGHDDWVLSVALSADGERLASASTDNTLILWEVRSGAQLRRFEGHGSEVGAVIFSPDDAMLLSGSRDRDVILWDIATGEEMQRFTGHTGAVWSLAFTPDGSEFLSGSTDESVRRWQVITTLAGLTRWAQENRYVRELSCVERAQFNLPQDAACTFPTPTPNAGSSGA